MANTPHVAATAPPIFDAHHPPDPALIDDCVHCGFCLPTCPTYLLWGEEMDSPRGRIYLMGMGMEGQATLDSTYVRHFDQCLGCMACVTACPSGVQYEKLIEATRAQIERHHTRTLPDRLFRRLLFELFPHPNRLRLAAAPLWLYQKTGLRSVVQRSGLLNLLPARLKSMEALLPPVSWHSLRSPVPPRTPARGQRPPAGGPVARLRPACVLRRCECCHGASARRRGV